MKIATVKIHVARVAVVWMASASVACLTRPVGEAPEGGASSSGAAATTLPVPGTTSGSPTPGTTAAVTTEADDTAGSTAGSSTGPGGLGKGEECDLMVQDCAPGLKCMPYAANPEQGGLPWDSTACFPVHTDPVGMGDPCQWFDGFFSGYDNCGFGQFCLTFSEKDPGVCRDICRLEDPRDDNWETLYCPDPMTSPSICQECFCWCDPWCNPLAPDCPEAYACYPIVDEFGCHPDASGELGAYGDPCEFVNVCNPGLMCLNAEAVPDCEGSIGCCTPYCDTAQPNTCPGPGQTCQPWFEDGEALPGLETLGVCALPA